MKEAFKLSVVIMLVTLATTMRSPAYASFTMMLNDGQGDTALVTDNGNGTQTITTHGTTVPVNGGTTTELGGALIYNGTLGKLNVDVSTGQLTENTPNIKSLDLNTLDHVLKKGAARSLTITLTETGLQLKSAHGHELLPLTLVTAGTLNSKGEMWQATAVVDPTNKGRTTGSGLYVISSPKFKSVGAFAFKGKELITLLGGPPLTKKFSLSVINSVTVASQGTLSGNSVVTAFVPEPTTLTSLAIALPFVGFGAVRRRWRLWAR